jgi:hypothetical protein
MILLGLPACVAPEAPESYAFGLTAEEVLAAKHVAGRPMTDAEWLALHRGELGCDRFGDLCRLVGEPAALELTELGYRMAIAGASGADIAAAQSAAIEAARVEPADIDPRLYVSDNDYVYGTGGGGTRRLKITATASQMWPSMQLRSEGDCRTQSNAFGWVAAASDQICGTLTATWVGVTIETYTSSACVDDTSHVHFGNPQRTADLLQTEIECTARDGGWRASGSNTISKD